MRDLAFILIAVFAINCSDGAKVWEKATNQESSLEVSKLKKGISEEEAMGISEAALNRGSNETSKGIEDDFKDFFSKAFGKIDKASSKESLNEVFFCAKDVQRFDDGFWYDSVATFWPGSNLERAVVYPPRGTPGASGARNTIGYMFNKKYHKAFYKAVDQVTDERVGLPCDKTSPETFDHAYEVFFKAFYEYFHDMENFNERFEDTFYGYFYTKRKDGHSINDLSEARQIAVLKRHPNLVKGIEDPSEAVQLIAVTYNFGGAGDSTSIRHIKNPTKTVQLAGVRHWGFIIKYIKNPDEDVQLAAVKQYGLALEFLTDPSEDVKLAAVKQNGLAIKFITDPSEALQLAAVKQNGLAIKFLTDPSEDVQFAAVKQNGSSIQYIAKPNYELQLAAVKNWSNSIQYIKDPSEELQILAVTDPKKHSNRERSTFLVNYVEPAIKFIKDPNEKVQLAAVRAYRRAIEHIQNPTETVQWEVLDLYGTASGIQDNKRLDKVLVESAKRNWRSVKHYGPVGDIPGASKEASMKVKLLVLEQTFPKVLKEDRYIAFMDKSYPESKEERAKKRYFFGSSEERTYFEFYAQYLSEEEQLAALDIDWRIIKYMKAPDQTDCNKRRTRPEFIFENGKEWGKYIGKMPYSEALQKGFLTQDQYEKKMERTERIVERCEEYNARLEKSFQAPSEKVLAKAAKLKLQN